MTMWDEMARAAAANTPSRFAPDTAPDTSVATSAPPAQPSALSRFARFATSGDAAVGAISEGLTGHRLSINALPGYLAKPLDILLSPVGLAAAAAAPFTGGASLEGATAANIAARVGTVAAEGVVGGLVGGEVSKQVDQHLPDSTPGWLRTGADLGAGLLAGGVTGHFANPSIEAAVAGRGATLAGSTQELAYPGVDNLLGLTKAGTGLTKTQQVQKFVLDALGKDSTKFNDQTSPIMAQVADGEGTVASQAAVLQRTTARTQRILGANGKTGLVPVLNDAGQTVHMPIPDIAAKLPLYAGQLGPAKVQAIQALGAEFEQWKGLAKAVGHEIGDRPDVMEGGVYLPRGNPIEDGVDHLVPAAPSSGGRLGAKAGAMKTAKYDSMAEGIANGETYPSLDVAAQQYALGVGRSIVGAHAANQLKALVDEDGNPVFTTALDRLTQTQPALVQDWNQANNDVASIRARLSTAMNRAGLNNKTADELDGVLERMQAAQPEGGASILAKVPGAVQDVRAEGQALSDVAPNTNPGSVEGAVAQDNRTFGIGQINAADHINTFIPEGADRIRFLDTAIANTEQRIDTLAARGGSYATDAEELRAQLAEAKAAVAGLSPQYQAALNSSPRDFSPVTAFPQLNGRSGPTAVVNAINGEVNPQTTVTKVAAAMNTVNAPLRALHTLMDFAFVSRVGPTALVNDPIAYLQSLGRTFKGLAKAGVADDFFHDLEVQSATEGLNAGPRDAAMAGVQFAGHGASKYNEFYQSGGLAGKLNNLPVINRGSQAFNDFTDMLRAQMFQNTVRDYANGVPLATRLASGNTAQAVDVNDPVVRQSFANMINRATGAGTGIGPGSTMPKNASAFIQFPRWLQSQFEQIGQAAAGGGVEGAYARQTLIKLVGLGMAATVGVNALTGQQTKFTNADGSWRVPTMRVGGQNIDVFGPMGSLVNGLMAASRGDISTLLRSKGSPLVQLGWDLHTGSNFLGQPVAWNDPGYWARQFSPYGISDLGTGKSPLSMGLNSLGVRASDETNFQQRVDAAKQMFNKDYADLTGVERQSLQKANPDLYQQLQTETATKAAAGDKLAQGILASQQINDTLLKQQDTLNGLYQSGQITPLQMRQALSDASSKAFTAKQQARTDFGLDKSSKTPTAVQDALNKYYAVYNSSDMGVMAGGAPTGQIDWDTFDHLQAALAMQLTPEQNKAIADRAHVSSPSIQWFEDNKALLQNSGYWTMKQAAFDRVKSAVQATVPDAQSPADLSRAVAIAQASGNRGAYNRLVALQNRMGTISGNFETQFTRQNPGLLKALVQNGYKSGKAAIGVPLGGQ